MRPFLLWFFLFLFYARSFSQEKGTDTSPLFGQLASAKDETEKVRVLNALAFAAYEKAQPDAGINYATQALTLANKLQLKEPVWEAKAVIGLCHDAKGSELLAKEFLESSIDTTAVPANKTLYIYNLRWLGNHYKNQKDYAKALIYALPLLAVRRRYDTKDKVAGTLRAIGDMYLARNDRPNALRCWTEAVNMLEGVPASDWISVYQNIGLVYFLQNDAANALRYYQQALSVSQQRSDVAQEAESAKSLGRVYGELKKDYVAAETYYRQALTFYEKTNNAYLMAVMLNNIAGTYTSRSLYPQALSHYLKSLRISESLGNQELLASNYNDISIVYVRNRQFKEAVAVLLKAKAGFEKLGQTPYLSGVHSNLGIAYLGLGDTANALKYIQVNLKGKPGAEDYGAVNNAQQNMGIIQSGRGNYAQALAAFSTSLQAAKNTNDSGLTAKSLLLLGKNYWEMSLLKDRKTLPDSLRHLSESDLLDKAFLYLNASLAYFAQKNMLTELQENHRLLAEVQKSRGDAPDAFEHFTKYVMFRDSVFNLEGATEMARLKLQYEFEKKEASAKARTRMWAVAGIGFVLFLALAFFFYRYREVSRFKSRMAGLRQQALNAQMSDHFIGNTMDSINGFIQHNEKEKASDYLNTFSRLIRAVLENASQKTILLSEDLDVLRSYLELEALRFGEGKFEYEINVDESVDAENTRVPPMVFQVLAENAIKHGLSKNAGGRVQIKVERKENLIECTVEDNGIGRHASALNKERQKQQRQSFGTSLAERLVRSVSKHKRAVSFDVTDLFDDSNNPEGTRVRFTLPYLPVD